MNWQCRFSKKGSCDWRRSADVAEMFLHLEMSSVRRRLQCCASRDKDLKKVHKVQRSTSLRTERKKKSRGASGSRRSPVADVVAAGKVQVLQSVEVRRCLCQAAVTDPRTVAERQAGQAAAVTGHRHKAGVADLCQHGQGEMLQVWVTHDLEGRSHSRVIIYTL